METLNIRYSKLLPVTLTTVGALLIVLSLLTAQVLPIVLGVVLDALGVLLLVNPYISVTETEVQVRNALGMVLKRYPITSLADLSTDGDRLSTRADGRKIISLGFMVNSEDVAELRRRVAAVEQC